MDWEDLLHSLRDLLAERGSTELEIEKALKIVAAAKEAAERGQGAVSVDGRMVDIPVVKRAEYTLVKAGLLEVK